MDQNDKTKLPFIKAGSIVPLDLTLAHVNGLYGIQQLLFKGIDKGAIEVLKIKLETKQPLQEVEMAIYSISIILQLIHESAEKNDMIEYRSVEETINNSISAAITE